MSVLVGTTRLARLHTQLAEVMAEMLRGEPLVDPSGRAILTEDGKPIFLRPKAAILKEVREFLKDNGIDSEPIDGTPVQNTAKALRQFDDEPLELPEPTSEE